MFQWKNWISNNKNLSRSPGLLQLYETPFRKRADFSKKYIKYQNAVTKIDLYREHKSYNLQEISYPQKKVS